MKVLEYMDIKFCIGQNAKENWDLFEQLKTENCDYIWFHLNSFSSPYVIMKSTLFELNDNSRNDFLIFGANLCKQNTKYRDLKDIKICYTSLKKLKKGDQIGEVIIKGKPGIIKL